MALIKLGSVVTRISGKVGGQTFGEGPSGAYLKNSGTPRKSITLSQRSKMSTMATTAQAWRALTQAQRDIFNAASPDYPYLNRVGETKFYSGYAIFTQLKNNGLNASYADIPVPLPKINFSPITASVTFIPSLFTLNISNSDANTFYMVYCSRISSLGISNGYKNKFYMIRIAGSGAGVVSGDLNSALIARFGTIPLSGKFYYTITAVNINTGQSLRGISQGVVSY